MKKLTAIVLSLLLCVGLLAGCGVTVVQYSPAAPSTDAEPTPSGEPGDTAEVAEGELALGFYMTAAYASGHSGSSSASADADGLAQANVDIYAVTINSEGVIVDCKIDAIQCKTNFNASGAITTDLTGEILSKMELDDEYAMRGASSISAEWDEQVRALEEYCIGKTPDEVAGIAVDDSGVATDADLVAGITMPLANFIDGVVAACNNARVNGAKEGDTLYLQQSSSYSSSCADASADADGLAQVDVTAGAFTLSADGTITDVDLDCVQTKINFNASGELTTEDGTTWQTKTDLDDEYNMRGASEIQAEWDEQTAFFEDYCRGKTVAEVAGISINPENNHPAEADLITGCTMNVNAFIAVLQKSQTTLEVPEGELALGFYMTTSYDTSYSGSHAASADGNGLAQANVDIYAVTINSEGVIVDCKIDAIQCKTEFDAAGALVTEIGAQNLSKMELGDDYAMRAASGIGAEWFEQVEALEQYCIGKTPAEVQGIALDDAGKATDADLIAGITMPLGDFISGVVAACNNARVNGAKEGDTLYLHSDSYLSDSSSAASADADGLAQNDTTAGAFTLSADGTITDVDFDCVQTKINFNASGELTTAEGTTWTTKTDLEYEYNMVPASPIGKEWFEQTAFFEDYCIGKTVAEVAGISIDAETSHPTEADLITGCTMNVNSFIAVLQKSQG